MSTANNRNDVHQSSEAISARKSSYSPYLLWLIWITWLPFIIQPILALVQSHPPLWRYAIMLPCAALFAATYAWMTLQNARALTSPSSLHIYNPKWSIIALLTVLSLILILLGVNSGNVWLGMFIFTSAYTSGRLPTRQAAPAVVGLTLLTIALGLLMHLSSFEAGQSSVFVLVVGIITMSLVRFVMTGQKLRAAQEEIARLAVMTERLRIARDLHDLLGHNLSLIALKSELAGRLLTLSPERAASEIRDIESVARTTLQEVREAVAAYRQATLANELSAAQEILAAANIAYSFKGDEAALTEVPSAIEALLAWTVREGVTNVVKHSRAHTCTIALMGDTQRIGIEISDDGTTKNNTGNKGNGLRGLKERVTTLGGQCEAGSLAHGGFRLAVFVPFTAKSQATQSSEQTNKRSNEQ